MQPTLAEHYSIQHTIQLFTLENNTNVGDIVNDTERVFVSNNICVIFSNKKVKRKYSQYICHQQHSTIICNANNYNTPLCTQFTNVSQHSTHYYALIHRVKSIIYRYIYTSNCTRQSVQSPQSQSELSSPYQSLNTALLASQSQPLRSVQVSQPRP